MEYTFQEMPDVHGTGKRKVYPKPFHCGRVATDFFMKDVAGQTAYAAGAIEALGSTMTEAMNIYLKLGHSVKVEGLGTFSIALGMKGREEAEEVKEKGERYDTNGVYIRSINFLPDPRWVERLRRTTELNKVGDVKKLHKVKSTREERLRMALDYLEGQPMIRIGDYAFITGLSWPAARKELHSFADDPTSGIRKTGRGNQLVFVKRVPVQP
jgi:predicted histone-like DNA-binding protein